MRQLPVDVATPLADVGFVPQTGPSVIAGHQALMFISYDDFQVGRTPRRTGRRDLVFAALAWLVLTMTGTPALATLFDNIGYTALQLALGDDTPDGSGVAVSLVESAEGGDCPNCAYMPNVNDSQFTGMNIVNGSGVSDDVSIHANGMSLYFFGDLSSVAQGVTDATVYETNDYLFDVLKVAKSGGLAGDPLPQQFKVQNHSWSGEISNTSGPQPHLDLQALRAFDFVIDNQEMTGVVGIDNLQSSEVRHLMAHSYNALAVGRTNGSHSNVDTGITSLSTYGPGRQKPDIVAPQNTTSRATATTSSAAAMLHESGAGTEAVLTEPMRAILLAGATKDEFDEWNRTETQPLDDLVGAGELNVFNSYRIQQGGQFDGSTSQPESPVGDLGWDYGVADPATPLYYDFEVPEFHTGTELSILLTWNVEVIDNDSRSSFNPSHSLANLDMQLLDSTGALVDRSISMIDNLEHIYLVDLAPGTYTLEVSSDSNRDFGLAWRLENVADGKTLGDYNGDGVVDSIDYAVWLSALGNRFDLRADGNLNGVVDAGDYNVWKNGFGQIIGAPAATSSASHSPEPATFVMLLLAGGLGLAGRYRPIV